MTPRRIVLLISDEYPPYTNWGGVAYHSAHLAKLLNRHGYDVEIIAESDNGEEFIHEDDQGNLVHRVNGSRGYGAKLLRGLAKPFGKRVEYRDLQFAARAAEKAFELTELWGRQILWVEATSWRAPSALLQLVPELNARTIVRNVTPRAEALHANLTARKGNEHRVALGLELLQQLLAKHRFYSNAEHRPHFEEQVRPRRAPGWDGAQERVFLLPFDFARVERRRAPPLRGKALRLLMVGRVEPRKGFDEICSALAGLTDRQRAALRIVAVGRDTDYGPLGSYQQLLLQRFSGIAESCFDFCGEVTDAELRRLVGEADVGLVASTSESFGYNLVELLAAGLPVLTSDVGAASELERRGVRYLGKFQDVAGLRALLGDLPARLARYELAPPDNRARLEALYRENDEAYLAYVRAQVALRVTPLKRPAPPEPPLESVDLIVPTYDRFEELTLLLPSALREVDRARREGIDCTATVVYQNEGLPERLYAWRPDLREVEGLRFVYSSPPSLTRARNVGLRHTTGDLVVFVDDDALLAPGFVAAHREAANAHPAAIGVAGRIVAHHDRLEPNESREVGQIRADGSIACNYASSAGGSSSVVPLTPMGANMAYKRKSMDALFGKHWFDERFGGSAFREKSMLALQIFRKGAHFVFAPDASLDHFESVEGGCNNRGRRTLRQRMNHDGLDDLFLLELYEQVPWLQWVGPAVRIFRDLRASDRLKTVLVKGLIHAGGYVHARRLQSARARRPRLVEAWDLESGPRAAPARPQHASRS